jgi:hypothetical protein
MGHVDAVASNIPIMSPDCLRHAAAHMKAMEKHGIQHVQNGI